MKEELSRSLPYLLKKRLQLSEELSLTRDHIRSLWHFYSAYNISLAITGMEDKNINRKNYLFRRLLTNYNKEGKMKILNKLNKYRQEEMNVINITMRLLESKKDESFLIGDNYKFVGCVGINAFYE